MNLKKKCSVAIQAVVAGWMIAILVAACGGTSGSAQNYTATAGVGEVLQISVDTANRTYMYSLQYTAYAASGVVAGQSSSGALLSHDPGGTYNLGPSGDGFILAGRVLPMQNGLLAGHVEIKLFGSGVRIPVFGLSHPISTLAGLAGTYSYQGFSCSASGIPNVLGNPACLARAGTITVTNLGAFTMCKGGDLNTSPGANACVATVTGTINAQSSTPAVFDFRNAANGHVGWFFAFNAPNGQKVAVIDHDDSISHEFGHSVLATYASAVAGAADGNYFVKDNEGGEQVVTVSGVSLTTTAISGAAGTLTLNTPWPGLNAYQFAVSGVVVSSGVALTSGAGVYTSTSKVDPAVFGVGAKSGR